MEQGEKEKEEKDIYTHIDQKIEHAEVKKEEMFNRLCGKY